MTTCLSTREARDGRILRCGVPIEEHLVWTPVSHFGGGVPTYLMEQWVENNRTGPDEIEHQTADGSYVWKDQKMSNYLGRHRLARVTGRVLTFLGLGFLLVTGLVNLAFGVGILPEGDGGNLFWGVVNLAILAAFGFAWWYDRYRFPLTCGPDCPHRR